MPINFRNKELQSHKQDLEIAFRNGRKVKRLSRKKSLPGVTYWFVRLSTTKPHRMGGWNNGNLFSQSSRGCKSKMRAGLPWGLSPCLPGGHPLHLAFLFSAYIPGASFFVSISSYSHTGLWPILMTSFQLNRRFKDLISNYSCILKYSELWLQYAFVEGTQFGP